MKKLVLLGVVALACFALPGVAHAQFQDDPGVDTCLGPEDPFCLGDPTTTGSGGSTSCMTCYKKGTNATCTGKTSCILLAILQGGYCLGEGTNCTGVWTGSRWDCSFSGACPKNAIQAESTVPTSLEELWGTEVETREYSAESDPEQPSGS